MKDVTDPQVAVDLDDLTDEQVLRRCERAREMMMPRVRATRAIVEASGHQGDVVAMAGFMSIFHPKDNGDHYSRHEIMTMMGRER